MRTALQLISGVAVAGVVAAGSAAFTGTGLTMATPTQAFVGGTVRQSVSGGLSVTGITYTWADNVANGTTYRTKLKGASVVLSAAAPFATLLTVAPGGGTYDAAADIFPCVTADRITWTCQTELAAGVATTNVGFYTPFTTFDVTVPSA